jgi:hypothetical protein
MKWVTREGPKVDRIACPWLIPRFVDSDAEAKGQRREARGHRQAPITADSPRPIAHCQREKSRARGS